MFLASVVLLVIATAILLWRACYDLDEESVPKAKPPGESDAEILPVDLSDRE